MICKIIAYRSKLVFRLHNSMAVSTFCAIVFETNPHKFQNILTYTGIMLLTRLFKTIPATTLILSQMCFISDGRMWEVGPKKWWKVGCWSQQKVGGRLSNLVGVGGCPPPTKQQQQKQAGMRLKQMYLFVYIRAMHEDFPPASVSTRL